jgi:asparagine synthase (glutamine-hydrolysing)
MLSRLNGIYAFAIWDDERGELFLARDRLGVKPLYYAERDGGLVFASEIKAMLPAIGRVALRQSAVADFLTFLWVPDPETMFEGVWKLPPGHCATWSRDGLRIRQWWDMSFAPERADQDVWVGRVRDEVLDSINRQTVSDVPLGSFLSGGVDSSAIVSELARAGKPTTFTVGFSQADLAHETVPDDVRYSRMVAEEFGLDYNERTLEADVVDLLPKVVWHLDEPVADPAAISTYLICSAAREQLTVVLSGMGGDEVFAGYPRHLASQLTRPLGLVPQRARAAAVSALEPRLTMGKPGRLRGPRRNAMKMLRGVDQSPDDRYLTYCSYYRPHELERVLSGDLRSSLRDHDPFRYHRDYLAKVEDQHWLNRRLYLDMKTFLPCLNLTYTDKLSMAASTEVRVPLLDDELVELSGRIPPRLKLNRLTRKYVFKKSMEGRLPRDVIYRPKAGFGAPVRSWLVGDLKPLVDEVLDPDSIRARGLLDPDEVSRIVRAGETGAEDNALRVWSFLTLELWQRTFVDQAHDSASSAAPAPVAIS